MSLIEMCSRVLAEVGWPVPSAIASNTDATAQQIFAIANTELRAISTEFEWPHLETEYTFATVAAQSQYAWPSDFDKVVVGSVFDTDEYYRIRGSENVERWNKYKHGLLGSLSHQRFRQVYVAGAPKIELTPTPTDVRNLVAFYMSKEFARNSAGASQELYVVDTDVSKVPEDLIELGVKWRFRRAKGLDFSAELAEYNQRIRKRFTAAKAHGDIPIGGNSYDFDSITEGYVPENGFGV